MIQRGIFGLALALCACGDPALDDRPVTEIGQAVFSPAVLSVTVENKGGGFVAPPPTGSTCESFSGKYALDVGTKKLTFTRCDSATAGAPYTPTSGSRTLSDAEYQTLAGVLGKLRVVKSDICGADKPTETLTVVTGSGRQEYGDAFYGCTIKDRPLVDSEALSQSISKARELSLVK